MGACAVKTVLDSEDLLRLEDGFLRRGAVQRVYNRKFSDGSTRWYADIKDRHEVLPFSVQTEKDLAKWWRDAAR